MEMITDLTNAALHSNQAQPPHCLKGAVNPHQADNTRIITHNALSPKTVLENPVAWADVFIDDHVALAQGPLGQLQQVCHMLLHNID